MPLVHLPWYATLFRADSFEDALLEIAPLALRYGASEWEIHRSLDDRYKFLQISRFAEKADWEAYWYGEDFARWRQEHSSWFQIPIYPIYHSLAGSGRVGDAVAAGNGPAAPG